MHLSKFLIIASLLACAEVGHTQTSIARGLFQTEVGDISDQEIVVVEVEYPPGVASAVHRHNAHTVVYVLQGAVRMQVAGGELKTLVAGEIFHETPDDVHTVSGNASDTEAAKILVFFLKKKDAATTEAVP